MNRQNLLTRALRDVLGLPLDVEVCTTDVTGSPDGVRVIFEIDDQRFAVRYTEQSIYVSAANQNISAASKHSEGLRIALHRLSERLAKLSRLAATLTATPVLKTQNDRNEEANK